MRLKGNIELNNKILLFNRFKQWLIKIPIISQIFTQLYIKVGREFQNQKVLYSKFIINNDLVFDVGACYGKKLVTFLQLNSRVIVIEPQKICMNYLKNNFTCNNVSFIDKALGETESTADFYEGKDHSLSTMSKEWMAIVKENHNNISHEWKNSYQVDVTTLDLLIEEYGMPSYIKIDVEGSELNVLKGLTKSVKMISFEYVKSNIQKSIDCIKHINNIANYEYNYSIGENHRLELDLWQDYKLIMNILSGPDIPSWGDIFSRLKE